MMQIKTEDSKEAKMHLVVENTSSYPFSLNLQIKSPTPQTQNDSWTTVSTTDNKGILVQIVNLGILKSHAQNVRGI